MSTARRPPTTESYQPGPSPWLRNQTKSPFFHEKSSFLQQNNVDLLNQTVNERYSNLSEKLNQVSETLPRLREEVTEIAKDLRLVDHSNLDLDSHSEKRSRGQEQHNQAMNMRMTMERTRRFLLKESNAATNAEVTNVCEQLHQLCNQLQDSISGFSYREMNFLPSANDQIMELHKRCRVSDFPANEDFHHLTNQPDIFNEATTLMRESRQVHGILERKGFRAHDGSPAHLMMFLDHLAILRTGLDLKKNMFLEEMTPEQQEEIFLCIQTLQEILKVSLFEAKAKEELKLLGRALQPALEAFTGLNFVDSIVDRLKRALKDRKDIPQDDPLAKLDELFKKLVFPESNARKIDDWVVMSDELFNEISELIAKTEKTSPFMRLLTTGRNISSSQTEKDRRQAEKEAYRHIKNLVNKMKASRETMAALKPAVDELGLMATYVKELRKEQHQKGLPAPKTSTRST